MNPKTLKVGDQVEWVGKDLWNIVTNAYYGTVVAVTSDFVTIEWGDGVLSEEMSVSDPDRWWNNIALKRV